MPGEMRDLQATLKQVLGCQICQVCKGIFAFRWQRLQKMLQSVAARPPTPPALMNLRALVPWLLVVQVAGWIWKAVQRWQSNPCTAMGIGTCLSPC